MTSCQRAFAFKADAAWYKLTFTAAVKHQMCHWVKSARTGRFLPQLPRPQSAGGKMFLQRQVFSAWRLRSAFGLSFILKLRQKVLFI
jgi:hypothetical protein